MQPHAAGYGNRSRGSVLAPDHLAAEEIAGTQRSEQQDLCAEEERAVGDSRVTGILGS